MAYILAILPNTTKDYRAAIESKFLYALQQAGLPADEVMIRFEEQQEYRSPSSEPEAPFNLFATSNFLKTAKRRNREQLGDLKEKLRELLRRDKTVSSFHIQKVLGLRDCDWAANTIRRLLKELIETGEVTMTGQKRGVQYHWTGHEEDAKPKLVKKEA